MSLSRRGAIVTFLAAATAGARAGARRRRGAGLRPSGTLFVRTPEGARPGHGVAALSASTAPAGEGLSALDFDAMGQIRFRSGAALWKDRPGGAVEFFHLGRYARTPVAIHVVEQGQARRILYSEALFDVLPGGRARRAAAWLGFAGFRVMNPGDQNDWIAYQGASYFRAADPFNQYGLSARGLAIDTATPHAEEFPGLHQLLARARRRRRLVV